MEEATTEVEEEINLGKQKLYATVVYLVYCVTARPFENDLFAPARS